MFAEASHPLSIPAGRRIKALLLRVLHALEPELPVQLPAELQRLPDHLLLDVGVEPHRVRAAGSEPSIGQSLFRREWP
jgi:hypothetical protein